MSNILAALLGGVGAGAQSYGGSLQREQEAQRAQMQRMAEMQEQEAARRRLAKEDGERAAAAALAKRTAGTASIRALFPDFQAPEGDYDAGTVMQGKLMQAQNARAEAALAGQSDRLERSLGGRMDQIEKQGGIQRGIAEANNNTRTALEILREKGRNSRDDGPQDKTGELTVKRAMELMQPQRDEFGGQRPGLSPEQARLQAEREVSAAMGIGPRSSPAASGQGNQTEGQEAARAQAKIQQIMSDASLSREDQLDMVQQVNEVLASRLRALRGGR